MGNHIVEEAKRCLQCKNPKCKQGCPVNTSIPEVIQLLLNSEIKKAGEILFNNNPFGYLFASMSTRKSM